MLSPSSTRPSDAPGRDHPRSSIRTPRRHRPPLRRNEGPRRLAWRGRGTRWTRQRQAWRRRSEAVRRPRDPTIVAHGPRGKSTLSPGERPLSSRQRTALVKNVSRMREERGADPRPACSAGRTAGPLHAVLATHPPRLLQARNSRHVAAHQWRSSTSASAGPPIKGAAGPTRLRRRHCGRERNRPKSTWCFDFTRSEPRSRGPAPTAP